MANDAGGNNPAYSISSRNNALQASAASADFVDPCDTCKSTRLLPPVRVAGLCRLDSRGRLSLRELLPQPLPAFEVLMIKLRTLQRKLRRLAHEPSLEHERHSVAEIDRLQLGLARFFERLRVRAVTRHAIVQASAARHESLRLGVVFPANQPHEFIHEIAVKPGRTERML